MAGKRILMTGGRGPATLELARQFNRLGHEVYIAEAQRLHFCTFSNAVKEAFVVPSPLVDEAGFIEALKSIIVTHKIDHLIPTYDEVYFMAKHKHVFSECVEVFCDHIEIIDTLNNKEKFMHWMDKLGLNAPETRMVDDQEAYIRLIQQNAIPYPHILKPVYTGGGVDVLKINNEAEALAAKALFPSLVQEFIEGDNYCTFGIAHQGVLSCLAIYKPIYIYRENGAAVCFQAIEDPAMLAFVSTIVEAAQFTGMLGFDVIKKKDGTLWAIECNPRITNGVHLVEASDNIDTHFFGLQSFRSICPEKPIQVNRLAMLRILGSTAKMNDGKWLHYFMNSKDAIFDWADPMPGLMMPLIATHFFIQYLRYKKTPEQTIFYNRRWSIEDSAPRSVSPSRISTHALSSLFCKPSSPRA